jgi:hypothetical protein
MPKPKNAMEIFQLLDKSNCRDCGQKTCLAFAGAVFTGRQSLGECPKLDRNIIEQFDGDTEDTEKEGERYLNELKRRVADLDFESAASRSGARVSGDRLTLKVLGKDFSVDKKGNLYSDIHVNPWIAVPFLNYILYGKGLPVSGKWVSFRELKDGREHYPLFHKRCEGGMKRVADIYPDLFDDMVHIFDGKQTEKQFKSDISVVLYVLPKVPIMVCYWFPDGGIESTLNIFFDETADKNLGTDSVFTLSAGLSQMFGKLSMRHGAAVSAE